jgi:hypothetical protein
MITLFARGRAACAFAAGLLLLACGPEHGFSGAWKQNCDDPEAGGCPQAGDNFTDGNFVYALHVGRYGDDVTGIVVRYTGNTYDPLAECGCYIMQAGHATDSTLEFTLKLVADGNGGGPGCAAPDDRFGSACQDALRTPRCDTLEFKDLNGDDDLLTGQLVCDGDSRPVQFVPASGKTRRTCLDGASCAHLPDAGTP